MKISKKIFASFMLFFLIALTLVGCESKNKAESTEGSTAGKIQIKLGCVGNEQHQSTIASQLFKKYLEESSDDFEVSVYPNAQLGGEREMAEGTKLGTIQMTVVTSDGTLPAWVPEIQILSIPYLFESQEKAYKALDGIISEKLNPKFEEAGFKHLAFGELGFRHFSNSKKEIKTVEDMKGLSFRVQEAPVWFALMDSLNASAVPVSFNELYTALQQGMVDGQENPIATVATQKFYEVQKYLSLDGHTYAAVSMVMNKDFFDKLNPEQQKLVQEAANKAAKEQRKVVSEHEEEYLEDLKNNGMIISEVDKNSFVEATKNIYTNPEVAQLVSPDFVEEVRDFIK